MNIELEFEVGDGFAIRIDKEMYGFYFSFPEPFDDELMPSKDAFKQLINEIKAVMKELGLERPSRCFILKFKNAAQHFSNNVSGNGVFLLQIPVKGYVGVDRIEIRYRHKKNQIYDKQELYHELIHIKDVVSGRFPTIGRDVKNISLINFLWMFSIEGRLKKMRKPHLEREEAIRLHKACALRNLISREQSERFCNELWGKKVTYESLKPIAKKLAS